VPFTVEYLGDTDTSSVLKALAQTIVIALPLSIVLVLWRVPEPEFVGRAKVSLADVVDLDSLRSGRRRTARIREHSGIVSADAGRWESGVTDGR
jgi:hypothetical protein